MLDAEEYQEQMSESTFLFLTLDLPTAPLYKDEKEQLIIPQVPLFNILAKFNGSTEKVEGRSHPLVSKPSNIFRFWIYTDVILNEYLHSYLHSGVQNLQREFSQKVPVDQTASISHILHQKIH